jgi:pyruvate formate lyase activating enzyme
MRSVLEAHPLPLSPDAATVFDSVPWSGLHRTSLVDYPGTTAAVLLTQGCNFRCSYCHSAALGPCRTGRLNGRRVWEFLIGRVGQLQGVVISGGEPLLHPELPEVLQEIRDLGYRIKVDTNGSQPAALECLLDLDLVDYVALDIKAPWDRYVDVVGIGVDVKAIRRSLAMLIASDLPHEVRTTVVPPLDAEDLLAILEQCRGVDRHYLQHYQATFARDRVPEAGWMAPNAFAIATLARRHGCACFVR